MLEALFAGCTTARLLLALCYSQLSGLVVRAFRLGLIFSWAIPMT